MIGGKPLYLSIASIVFLLFLGWVGILTSIVLKDNPLDHSLARLPLWPVACSTRGCVTTATWAQYHTEHIAFSQSTQQEHPTPVESLTTVVRRHLLDNAFVKNPASMADARRYREEILHITSQDQLQKVGIQSSLIEYDADVILPLLLQEALRQQRQVESTDELYAQLAKERFILLLIPAWRWDKDTGAVHPRS